MQRAGKRLTQLKHRETEAINSLDIRHQSLTPFVYFVGKLSITHSELRDFIFYNLQKN